MPRYRASVLLGAALLAIAGTVFGGAALDGISNREAVATIKLALLDTGNAAAARLGITNGFFGNDRVRIRLPHPLQRVEVLMRATGLERQAEELVLAMNRAAEASMPAARTLLQDAVKNMKVGDAKRILASGDNGIADYAARATAEPLARKFLPVIRAAATRAGVIEKYNAIAHHGKQLGLLKSDQIAIEQYVTEKALYGLYLTMGEEEKALRQNPGTARSGTVQKVFAALR
jgi:hypothetical protein